MTKGTTRLIETTLGQIKDGWKPSINRFNGETDLKPTKLSSGQLSQMLIQLHGENLSTAPSQGDGQHQHQ